MWDSYARDWRRRNFVDSKATASAAESLICKRLLMLLRNFKSYCAAAQEALCSHKALPRDLGLRALDWEFRIVFLNIGFRFWIHIQEPGFRFRSYKLSFGFKFWLPILVSNPGLWLRIQSLISDARFSSWILILDLSLELHSGFSFWFQIPDSDCGLRFWIQSLGSDLGIRFRTQSLESDQTLGWFSIRQILRSRLIIAFAAAWGRCDRCLVF